MDVVKYREGSFMCSPGDGLLLYTDGVSEAANAAEELYGEERLLETLARINASGGEGVPVGSDMQAPDVAAAVSAAAGIFRPKPL